SQFGEPIWYYVAIDTKQAAFTRPRAYKEQALQVHFAPDGTVSRVDRSDETQIVRLDPDGHKTPTLGRERGFLEDLFRVMGAVGGAGLAGPGGGNTGGGATGSCSRSGLTHWRVEPGAFGHISGPMNSSSDSHGMIQWHGTTIIG